MVVPIHIRVMLLLINLRGENGKDERPRADGGESNLRHQLWSNGAIYPVCYFLAEGMEWRLLVIGRTSARPPERESAGGKQEEHIFVFWYGIPPIPNTQEFCEAAVRNGV